MITESHIASSVEMAMTYIPYLLRSELIQIDPMLDIDWESRLVSIFNNLDEDIKIEIDKQILKSKQIIWHRISNKFDFKTETSLQVLKFKLEDQRMRSVVANIIESIQLVQNNDNVLFFADYIENVLKQIDQIETNDDLKLIEERAIIRKTFLYHIAKVIRKKTFIVPSNIRNLTEEQVKNFIIEVYIKHEILGHWFRPMTTKQIEKEPNFFFKYYISRQQKVRKFSVVKTSQFYFFLAPGRHVDDNVYSIRRFLTEQVISYSNSTYIFSLALPLNPSSDAAFISSFKELMEKMVTIEYRINQAVTDIVANMEYAFQDVIIPLFVDPLVVSEKNLDLLIDQHLMKIENKLVEDVLTPIKKAVQSDLSVQDEFDYVFHSLRNVFKEMLNYFEVFKQQPLFVFNQKVQEFGYRILSYLILLERRRDEVFASLTRNDREMIEERAQEPMTELYQLIDQRLAEYMSIQADMKTIDREKSRNTKQSFVSNLMTKKTVKRDYADLYRESLELKKKAYHDLLYIPRQYKKYCVIIQEDNLMSIQGRETYYAFSNGDNGIGLLPILFHVKNDLTDFSIEKVYNTLRQNVTRYSPFQVKRDESVFAAN